MTIVRRIKEQNMTKTVFKIQRNAAAATRIGAETFAIPIPGNRHGDRLGEAISWPNRQWVEGRRQADVAYQ